MSLSEHFGINSRPEDLVNKYDLSQQQIDKYEEYQVLQTELANSATYADIDMAFRKQARLESLKAELQSSVPLRGTIDLFTYRPAGSRLFNFFPNPFGVFAYLAENYFAAQIALDLIRTEIETDSYVLKTVPETSLIRKKEVHARLKKLQIDSLRTELAVHLKVFGNAFVLPHFDMLGNVVELEMIYPDRLYPLYDRNSQKIIGWQYQIGIGAALILKPDEILHLKLPSVKTNQIGVPPLGAAVVSIEADLYADMFNNMVFQKGGLIGAIISLESPQNDMSLSTGRDDEEYVRLLQRRIESQYSGARSGQGLAVMTNVKNVHQVTDIGKLDANFLNAKEMTAKNVAYLLGIPSEKLGITRSKALQYSPQLVEDTVNSAFDKNINRLTNMVDRFINTEILMKLMGVTDIKITSSGRFGALTLNAAQVIKVLADAGNMTTVNEARTRILGWEALDADDPRGSIVLDNSLNRDKESAPPETGMEVPDLDLDNEEMEDDIDYQRQRPEENDDEDDRTDGSTQTGDNNGGLG